MRILAIGDVIGRPGRRALKLLLPELKSAHSLDFVIANGENVAGGIGITPETAQELLQSGVDVVTTGNHVWAQKEIIPYLETEVRVLRPLNYPPGVPGCGHIEMPAIVVVNLLGETFIGNFECPFRTMDHLLSSLGNTRRTVIVDFHAEATSEKVAMGRYLDGRVSAVLGTHTHVGTIDACLLPGGTAYVTDIGMTGPVESIIGDDMESVIDRFLTKMPHRMAVGRGKTVLNAILVEVDESSGRAISIERIQREVNGAQG